MAKLMEDVTDTKHKRSKAINWLFQKFSDELDPLRVQG
jgi:hypothetical protein